MFHLNKILHVPVLESNNSLSYLHFVMQKDFVFCYVTNCNTASLNIFVLYKILICINKNSFKFALVVDKAIIFVSRMLDFLSFLVNN